MAGNLPAYSPHLNPDEQVWNHAKARFGTHLVAIRQEFEVALLSIMRSIQRATELLLSFFSFPTQNMPHAQETDVTYAKINTFLNFYQKEPSGNAKATYARSIFASAAPAVADTAGSILG